MKSRALLTGVLIAFVAGVAGFLIQQQFTDIPHQRVLLGQVPEKSLVGELRPDFSLPDKDGNMRSIEEWDGKVVVINFWATWCPPCRDEIPAFIKLQDKYNDQGLQFVGIALQTADEVRNFVSEFGMNYPVLVGTEEVIKVAEAYGNHIGALPYTVIIDRQQRIAFIKAGPMSYEEAEAAILAVL